jgi:autotransporter-associated beta strand protein
LTGDGGFKFTGSTSQSVTVGNSSSNYTGTTEVTGTNFTVKAGTNNAFGKTSLLQVTDATATVDFSGYSQTVGGLTGDGEITNGQLTVDSTTADSTFDGTLTGSTALTKTGAKTLTLSGENTYTGETKINAGTLALTGSGKIDKSSAVTVNGTFDISGLTNTTEIQNLQGNGFVDLGSRELEVTDGNFGGVIYGTGNLTKSGNAATTLTLSGVNTYTGATAIDDGTLALTGNGSIAASSGVNVVGADNIFDISGITAASTSVQDLSGNGFVKLASKELNVAKGGFSGVIEGNNGTLTKYSNGTLILSGDNTYSGETNITDGKLILTGTINSSAVNVVSGTTLEVQGAKTLHNLSSAGTVTFDNALTLAGNNDTSISGLDGNNVVTKTGTGTTTLGDNQAGTFVQNSGNVKLTGKLTGNYQQNAGQFTADAGTGTAEITGTAKFVNTLKLDKKLQTGGNTETNHLELNDGSITVTNGNLNVTGNYSDTAGSSVDVKTGEFKFAQNNLTINSTDFHAKQLTIADDKTVIFKSAGVVIDNLVNLGTMTAADGGTTTIHSSITGNGNIWIGNENSANIGNAKLHVEDAWNTADRSVNFAVDDYGKVGTLEIDGVVRDTGTPDIINLNGAQINRNKLAVQVSEIPHNLITADTGSDVSAFQISNINDNLNNNTNSWKFLLNGNDDETNTIWQLTAESEIVVPDISSMFLTNIMGFDLPRAQNAAGPWGRYKGGQLTDHLASLDESTYQMLQIGWDKMFDAVYGGNWYAGVFMEGDWMYGRGVYRRTATDQTTQWVAGHLKSEHRGMGAGLYVSRGFKNDAYIDLLGRINTFGSEIKMSGINNSVFGDTSDYRGKWTENIFAFAVEVGKTFNSKNKRWSWNPYNRILYHSAPSNDYAVQITGNDPLTLNVHTNTADTWTNQLGNRLYWKSLHKGQTLGNVYLGMDYYQGLSGKFGGTIQAAGSKQLQEMKMGRPKNNLAYGIGTIGGNLSPTDSVILSMQIDMVFGDVSGYAVTFGGRYSY